MTIELPAFRLGLAGFGMEHQDAIARMLALSAGDANSWEVAEIDAADALWINGVRTQVVALDRIRVAPGLPTGRSLQFDLADMDRPVAFAETLPPDLHALCTFDAGAHASMVKALRQIETWLAPVTAQFSLASHIAEHQSALGAGKFELRLNGELLALVDMHGEAAVRSTAQPDDFEAGAIWQRARETPVPDNFVRTSLSQLMWQYAMRTQRDLLPRHYRTGLIYFRRAPRLPQSCIKDSHLLAMRELMLQPATFAELQQRCGMDEERMARELAALYFVGTITSSRKRAAPFADSGAPQSDLNLDSLAPPDVPPPRRRVSPDLTAPAPLRADH